jgi:hypothetical protein
VAVVGIAAVAAAVEEVAAVAVAAEVEDAGDK